MKRPALGDWQFIHREFYSIMKTVIVVIAVLILLMAWIYFKIERRVLRWKGILVS